MQRSGGLATGRNRDRTRHEDGVLVARAKKDTEAFDTLYRKYVKKVYTYVYYRVGGVEDAEDITESVFLHALLNLERYQDRGIPFSAWLLRIAHNLVANWHRRAEKRKQVDVREMEGMGDDALSPDEAVEEEEEYREVRRALAALPEDKQQVLILRFAEGMRYREIGEVMGKSAGAVKVLAHRSLMALHKILAQKEEG